MRVHRHDVLGYTRQDGAARDLVFVSYSHRDHKWLGRILHVLAPDVRNDRIAVSDDRDIAPGDPWLDSIFESIDRAKVALLLVSPSFLASTFVREHELPRILRAAADGLRVVWVPVEGDFDHQAHGMAELMSLQAAFDPFRPLATLSSEEQDRALIDLCRTIRRCLEGDRVRGRGRIH